MPANTRGWLSQCWGDAICKQIAVFVRVQAAMSLTLLKVKRTGAILARGDKETWYHEMAFRASRAAANADFASAFGVVRAIGGFRPTPMKTVKCENGRLACSEEAARKVCGA